ncbi:MAG TPA: NADH-quinone oxidoreductase subunit NuoK [Candidatus Methylomirabilis sp.]|nr:NADH-quinone oxidoreductase subunit NuoK [Candidatus Methylomirabilis sp.]
MQAPVNHYLVLAAILFAIGVFGVLLRRNVIVMLMSVELMLNAVNVTFVALARKGLAVDGQVIVFFVMTVAAAEVAIGLAIILAVFAQRRTVNADEIGLLRW